MVRIRVTCVMSGPTFSPAAAERATGLGFQRKSEPGQQVDGGPFQGRADPGGRCELPVQEYGAPGDLGSRNPTALMALGRSVEALRRAGATEIELRFDVEYSGHCLFMLPAELVRKVADLGIPMVVACFATDVTEELAPTSQP